MLASVEQTPSLFRFDDQVLNCIVGGVSAIDIPSLHLKNDEEARQFVGAYGFDLANPVHLEQIWGTYRRAISLVEENLLDAGEVIPHEVAGLEKPADVIRLLLLASSNLKSDRDVQRWSCALLRVMHVDVHLRYDLFGAFRDEIQAQILKPIQDAIVDDDMAGYSLLGPNSSHGGIRLHKFEIKPFKTTASSVVKLLARSDRVALQLLDKLGVRFVTKSLFDSFRVIRFLSENHLVSFPHIIPDQSNNTLYPINLFQEVMQELEIKEQTGVTLTQDEIREQLTLRLETDQKRAQYREKLNEFSGPEYRFVKFINRRLITVTLGIGDHQRPFRFFYPFEVQIVDQETYMRNLTGPMAHSEYKKRQRQRARERVFGVKYASTHED